MYPCICEPMRPDIHTHVHPCPCTACTPASAQPCMRAAMHPCIRAPQHHTHPRPPAQLIVMFVVPSLLAHYSRRAASKHGVNPAASSLASPFKGTVWPIMFLCVAAACLVYTTVVIILKLAHVNCWPSMCSHSALAHPDQRQQQPKTYCCRK